MKHGVIHHFRCAHYSVAESSLEKGTPVTEQRKKQTAAEDTSVETVELSMYNSHSDTKS